eukprot:TRINITY_DN7436_c0_g1_i3.p1 TRINITY_DN7436_c0_g1~~TRINITY_DN7436_c0_g1_i3.p1  ORF type:complete len:272 (+),score=48.04 TRINITY_DN7436_c0_g1_i3:52-816(+)
MAGGGIAGGARLSDGPPEEYVEIAREGPRVRCDARVPHWAAVEELGRLGMRCKQTTDEMGRAVYECRDAETAAAVWAFLRGANWRFWETVRRARSRSRSRPRASSPGDRDRSDHRARQRQRRWEEGQVRGSPIRRPPPLPPGPPPLPPTPPPPPPPAPHTAQAVRVAPRWQTAGPWAQQAQQTQQAQVQAQVQQQMAAYNYKMEQQGREMKEIKETLRGLVDAVKRREGGPPDLPMDVDEPGQTARKEETDPSV